MIWSQQPVRARAPATSANLGPGFDALGLALALHDEVEAAVTGSGLAIEVLGEGAETAGSGEDHLVVRAMRAAFGLLGAQPPGIALRCVNAIPHGRGLGSSAAAIVSGILAARALAADGADRLSGDEVFSLAVRLEGHPDNVAACLRGGLTIAWTPGGPDAGGGPAARMASAPVLAGLRTIACVPPTRLSTRTARGVLPAQVPHADAAANAARSALLIAALTADPSWLFDATEDFLHQRYRAGVMPTTADLLRRLREAGLPAAVSGAGPAVLVFAAAPDGPGGPPAADLVGSITRETGIAWRVIPLDIDRQGATVQPAGPGARLPESARQGSPWNHVQGASAPRAEWSP